MQFYTRDWLDNKELARCSPVSKAVLVGLMCLAHEGKPYGFLADSSGPLSNQYMASRCFVTGGQMSRSIQELVEHTRLTRADAGGLFIQRMVEDEAERIRRKEAGSKGGNPKLVKRVVNRVVEPPCQPRSDSDSVCVSSCSENTTIREIPQRARVADLNGIMSQRFDEVFSRWPRKTNRDSACRDWVSLVTVDIEDKVFACVDRYLASAEVARGAVRNLGSSVAREGWLVECAKDNWDCDWPPAVNGNGKDSGPELDYPTFEGRR